MLFRRVNSLAPEDAAAALDRGELQLVDVRGAVATRAAAKAGLDAANVSGGVVEWARAGLPLTRAAGGAA
jgi:rhodanese-related sulfurtransferase